MAKRRGPSDMLCCETSGTLALLLGSQRIGQDMSEYARRPPGMGWVVMGGVNQQAICRVRQGVVRKSKKTTLGCFKGFNLNRQHILLDFASFSRYLVVCDFWVKKPKWAQKWPFITPARWFDVMNIFFYFVSFSRFLRAKCVRWGVAQAWVLKPWGVISKMCFCLLADGPCLTARFLDLVPVKRAKLGLDAKVGLLWLL